MGCCTGLSVTWLWCSPDRPHICSCLHVLTGKEQLCLISPGFPHGTLNHCTANNQLSRSYNNLVPPGSLCLAGQWVRAQIPDIEDFRSTASPGCRYLESSHSLQIGTRKWWRSCDRSVHLLPPPPPFLCNPSPHASEITFNSSWTLRSFPNISVTGIYWNRMFSHLYPAFHIVCECH